MNLLFSLVPIRKASYINVNTLNCVFQKNTISNKKNFIIHKTSQNKEVRKTFSNATHTYSRISKSISNSFRPSSKSIIKNKSYHFSNNILGIRQARTRKISESFHDNNATLLLNSFFSSRNAVFYSRNKIDSDYKKNLTKSTSLTSSQSSSESIPCLISKPSFSHTNHKVTIQLFYYIPNTLQNKKYTSSESVFSNEMRPMLTSLSTYLCQLYKKEVSLVMIRLHYPYLDSYILAQYLAHNAPNNTFIQFQETIFTNAAKAFYSSDLPSHITGIKVQISGRLITESVIPRITVKSSLIGSFCSSQTQTQSQKSVHQNSNNTGFSSRRLIDYSRFTHKNNIGSFTIKVWIASRVS